MKSNIIRVLFFCLLAHFAAGQVKKSSKGTFALTNATLETITKGRQTGNLIIRDGKIESLGPGVAVPSGATIIDCQGLTIYPGLIDGGTQLGLVEVSSISLTDDTDELGELTPHMEAITAFNTSATAVAVTRVDGISTALVVPQGGLFPGTASLVNLVGYTPDQIYAGFRGVVLNFPGSGRRGFWDRRSDEDLKKEEEKALRQLNEVWTEAQYYVQVTDAAAKNAALRVAANPEMARLAEVIRGTMPLLIETNRAADIEAAIRWAQDKKIPKVILTGVAEGWRVADKIAKAGYPVITGPVIALPTRGSDAYDKAYANAGLMAKAGVKVAIRSNDSENVRNLPFHAGFAAAYGMGKEEALRAVTITPAEIMGVADKLGSLEAGKTASLMITTGDPFEPKTQIRYLFIDGWIVPLDSRQIQLYEEFLNRSPGLKK